ncbi:MAG: pentapeptide repeat-containing protein [Leptolyngbyaceae cyanobacterium]
MKWANLRGSDLRDANLHGAILDDAAFYYTFMPDGSCRNCGDIDAFPLLSETVPSTVDDSAESPLEHDS